MLPRVEQRVVGEDECVEHSQNIPDSSRADYRRRNEYADLASDIQIEKELRGQHES